MPLPQFLRSRGIKESSFIYWTRALIGLLIGVYCWFFGLDGIRGASVSVITYMVTYYIYRYGFEIEPEEVGIGLTTTGIGAYFVLWILCWGLLVTLFPRV